LLLSERRRVRGGEQRDRDVLLSDLFAGRQAYAITQKASRTA
jgi:hypothetical protein